MANRKQLDFSAAAAPRQPCLQKIVYRAPGREPEPDAAWLAEQDRYLHRHGSILAQPEIQTRRSALADFLKRRPDLAHANDDVVYAEFARQLPKIHAYRAIALHAHEFEKIRQERRILTRGAYQHSLEASIEAEKEYGYLRGVRSRLHVDQPLPLDFTLSLHGDRQTALCVALYSWKPEQKIYLFEVEIPAIQVLNLKIPDIAPNLHYFFFMGLPFDARDPAIEFFVLNKVEWHGNVKTIQLFSEPDEVIQELAGLKERLESAFAKDNSQSSNPQVGRWTNMNVRELIAELGMTKFAGEEIWHDARRRVDYPIVATPGAFDKPFVGVILPGAFEPPGIWSSSLVQQNQLEAGTMMPYFQEFASRKWGLIALSPFHFSRQAGEEESACQLDNVFSRLAPGQRVGLMGFSAGGRYLIHYLCQNAEKPLPIAGVVLLDPVAPRAETIETGIPASLSDALVFSAELYKQGGLGSQAAATLNLPVVRMSCYHPQIPHLALPQVLEYWTQRI